MATAANDRIRRMSVASVHVHYVAKAEKQGRGRAEVDEVIRWLTGYSDDELAAVIAQAASIPPGRRVGA